MYKKLPLTILGILSLFVIAACSSTADTEPTAMPTPIVSDDIEAEYRTLEIEAFADVLENNPDDYTIINVHIPYAGEIDGTNDNVAFNDLDALTAAIPDRNTPVILYCRSGNMSEQASRALVELGYTQVWDVPGGMNAWQATGRELEDK